MTFPFTSSGAAVGIAARDSRSTNNNNNNDEQPQHAWPLESGKASSKADVILGFLVGGLPSEEGQEGPETDIDTDTDTEIPPSTIGVFVDDDVSEISDARLAGCTSLHRILFVPS